MSDTRRIRADSRCVCGHTHFNHDTGWDAWDAAGCMVGDCPCRDFRLAAEQAAKEPDRGK